ncbi:Neurotransmitter-gated ion-channel transmembrane region [Cichlidogyrus casuarinus]|uniref:Neurotransmitter-gated ion-channel transmembrane region n=1 Tax=Cichlidogyrus casuarinus TaxID=1844966 RepID=A0ABD2Q0G3_9PLAT
MLEFLHHLSAIFSVFICIDFCASVNPDHSRPKTAQERLLEYLYNHKKISSRQRPVWNESETLTVTLQLQPVQIIQLDEKTQTMKSNVWLNFEWIDYLLTWNPEDFQNISDIRINPSTIWKPDVILLNNADGQYNMSYHSDVVVYSNGSVLWVPPSIYKTTCNIDVEYFPLDVQVCEMQFMSLSYSDKEVNLTLKQNKDLDSKPGLDAQYLKNLSSWLVVSIDSGSSKGGSESFSNSKLLGPTVSSQSSPINSTNKDILIYKFKLSRMPLFYVVNLIIPCILIAIVSVWVFYLPADAGEKMTISISVLIAQVIFMLLVSKMVPASSSKIPLISKFLLFTFLVNFIIIITTVIMINWNHRTAKTYHMSQELKEFLVEKLPSLMFIRRPPTHDLDEVNLSELENLSSLSETESEGSSNTDLDTIEPESSSSNNTFSFCEEESSSSSSVFFSSNNFRQFRDIVRAEKGNNLPSEPVVIGNPNFTKCRVRKSTSYKRLPKSLRRSMKSTEFITKHIKEGKEAKQTEDDWKFAAVVLDRLQMLIFFSILFFGSFYILLDSPYFVQ